MLTNNFYNMAKAGNYGLRIQNNQVYQMPGINVIATDGTQTNGWAEKTYALSEEDQFARVVFAKYADSRGTWKLAVGSGTGEFNPAMTTLTNMLTSPYIYNDNIGTDSNGNMTISGVITNTTESEYVISEVGYLNRMYLRTSASSGEWRDVLFARQLLETPITLQPGESASVTMLVEW